MLKVRKDVPTRKRSEGRALKGGAGLATRLLVAPCAGAHSRGKLVVGPLVLPCALGRGGVRRDKREGDGATPAGSWACMAVFHRRDRLRPPPTRLPTRALTPRDGWCDDPGDRRYNRWVSLPFPGRHEELWRADGLYDLIVVLDHNLRHPRPGRGSAVFLHVADPGWAPTAGCVALRRADLARLLPRLSRRSRLAVQE